MCVYALEHGSYINRYFRYITVSYLLLIDHVTVSVIIRTTLCTPKNSKMYHI